MIKIDFFTFSPIAENTYVLSNEKGDAFIIDPGCYFSTEEKELASFLVKSKLNPVKLLNTHCHLDHVFGNHWVHKNYGLQLHLHPDEKKLLDLAPASGNMYGLPFTNYTGPLHFINENEKIFLGNDELETILAPGHSPGSLCFYCRKQNFLIGGDVLFYESIGRTDLPFGNHEQLLKSIKEKLFRLPDETIVYPGHGEPTTIGHEKKNNPFLR